MLFSPSHLVLLFRPLCAGAPALSGGVGVQIQTSRRFAFMTDLSTKSFLKPARSTLCNCSMRQNSAVDVCLLGRACAESWSLESIGCQLPKHNKSKQVFDYVDSCNMKARRAPGVCSMNSRCHRRCLRWQPSSLTDVVIIEITHSPPQT